jgi:hypothetical protein
MAIVVLLKKPLGACKEQLAHLLLTDENGRLGHHLVRWIPVDT